MRTSHTSVLALPHGVRGGVAAVERALLVLEAFSVGTPPHRLVDLAERTGLYKSTILRLLASLEAFGYVRRIGNEYYLGPKLLALGTLYQESFKLEKYVMPVLHGLVEKTNESASFYVREGRFRVCLFRLESTQAVRHHARVGDRLPIEAGATGHVLRLFEEGADVQRTRSHRKLPIATFGEWQTGTAAIAAPVFGLDQQLVGAISVSGPETRFTPKVVTSTGVAVMGAARDLTGKIGGDPRFFDDYR